jgi:hypothetical protein
MRYALASTGMAGQAPPMVGAVIASHLSNLLSRAKAANGVTGYDQPTVVPVGRVGLGKGSRTGTLHHADPPTLGT